MGGTDAGPKGFPAWYEVLTEACADVGDCGHGVGVRLSRLDAVVPSPAFVGNGRRVRSMLGCCSCRSAADETSFVGELIFLAAAAGLIVTTLMGLLSGARLAACPLDFVKADSDTAAGDRTC